MLNNSLKSHSRQVMGPGLDAGTWLQSLYLALVSHKVSCHSSAVKTRLIVTKLNTSTSRTYLVSPKCCEGFFPPTQIQKILFILKDLINLYCLHDVIHSPSNEISPSLILLWLLRVFKYYNLCSLYLLLLVKPHCLLRQVLFSNLYIVKYVQLDTKTLEKSQWHQVLPSVLHVSMYFLASAHFRTEGP